MEEHTQYNLPINTQEEPNPYMQDFLSSPNVLRTDKTLNVKDFYSFNDQEARLGKGQKFNRTAFSTLVSGSVYSVAAQDYLIAVTDLSYAPTIGLPRPLLVGQGKSYIVKDEAGGATTTNITIRSVGEETIDGASTATITTNYQSKGFYSDGQNWFTREVSGSGAPASPNNSIQFNDAGSFGGSSQLTFDKTQGGALTLIATDSSGASNGGDVDIEAGKGGDTGVGGKIFLLSGNGGGTSGDGGEMDIESGPAVGGNSNGGAGFFGGGDGSGSGNGGTVEVYGGDGGGSTGNGGSVKLTTGGTTGGDLGNIYLNNPGGTNTSNRNGGFVFIPTTTGAPTGTPSAINNTVAITYDTGDNKLYIYNGGWKSVLLS